MSLSLDRRTMLGGILALPAIIRPGQLMPVSARGARVATDLLPWPYEWDVVRDGVFKVNGQFVVPVQNWRTGERRMLTFARGLSGGTS